MEGFCDKGKKEVSFCEEEEKRTKKKEKSGRYVEIFFFFFFASRRRHFFSSSPCPPPPPREKERALAQHVLEEGDYSEFANYRSERFAAFSLSEENVICYN